MPKIQEQIDIGLLISNAQFFSLFFESEQDNELAVLKMSKVKNFKIHLGVTIPNNNLDHCFPTLETLSFVDLMLVRELWELKSTPLKSRQG